MHFSTEDPHNISQSQNEYQKNQYPSFSDSLMLKLNTGGENRTGRSLAAAPWRLTSLDKVGNASPAPAAAALCARLSGGLLQLFGYTKCVPLLQAKQGTHVVQVMEDRQQTKGMSAFVSWWFIRSICGGSRPVSLFLIRAKWYCLFCTMDLSIQCKCNDMILPDSDT